VREHLSEVSSAAAATERSPLAMRWRERLRGRHVLAVAGFTLVAAVEPEGAECPPPHQAATGEQLEGLGVPQCSSGVDRLPC
jgi:hypothetical protein